MSRQAERQVKSTSRLEAQRVALYDSRATGRREWVAARLALGNRVTDGSVRRA